MNDGSFAINIFVDFKKCFDTIDHEILINKLEMYGITGMALNLIANYLANRTQSVRVGKAISSPKAITKGIPQGSILGPLLFLFFINDLTNISNNLVPLLYADDTTLNFKCSTIEEANVLCNTELQTFFTWASSNRLSINFGRDKTYYMLHSFRTLDLSDLQISMNDNVLENFDEAPFLGVILDKKLNYQPQIDHIAKQISKSIGILYKLRCLKTPRRVLKQAHDSLILPYLNYCICCYSGTYSTHLNRLLLLQKRAIRIINNAPFLAHTDPLFLSSGILKIYDLYKLNVGAYMFDHWQSGGFNRTHQYNTRNRDDLLPNRPRLTVARNSLSVAGPNIWNTIPSDIQNSLSKGSFKFRYKQYLLSQYLDQGD